MTTVAACEVQKNAVLFAIASDDTRTTVEISFMQPLSEEAFGQLLDDARAAAGRAFGLLDPASPDGALDQATREWARDLYRLALSPPQEGPGFESFIAKPNAVRIANGLPRIVHERELKGGL